MHFFVNTFKTVTSSYAVVPKSIEELNHLQHEQVLQLVAEIIFPQDPTVLTAMKKEWTNDTHSSTILNGVHLYNAIQAYKQILQSGGTKEIATQNMVNKLMEEEKVTSTYVAKSMAYWLQNTYIKEKKERFWDTLTLSIINWLQKTPVKQRKEHDWNTLNSIKNDIDEKWKKMKEVKPSLPPPLYHETSELGMIFRNTKLSPSICFGPTLPRNKYQEYFEFLFEREHKSFVTFCLFLQSKHYFV